MDKNQSPILKLDHISYSIRTGFFLRPLPIIKDVTFELEKGKVLGLIGSNGAGKTTTLNLCVGLIRPSKGSATCKGEPVYKAEIKHSMGYLAEIQHPFKYLKVEEWFYMLGKLSNIDGKKLKKRISVLISVFELYDLKKKKMHQLSKGQLQRVNFAQTLIHKPEILILDEPMSGLDAYWRNRISSILKQYKENGGSIIFSSHVLTDVKAIADEIACIDKGQIQWVSSVSQIDQCFFNRPCDSHFEYILF